MRTPVCSTFLALLTLCSVAHAEVGDVTLRTDHPQYAGEGAFQTIEDCVRFATAAAEGKPAQERAIAMYLWLLTHQWHLASPQECFVPGEKPDTKRDNAYDMIVYDANRARFSYGYGLCGTVHAWNEPYWKAMGMNARRRAFPGHTNSEIEYDGSWHTFDTDMAGLIFRADGVVAGYEDVMKDPACATRAKPPLPCYPFAWPGDFEGMKKGWAEIAKGGKWYKMYGSGYAAQPGVVHLRKGETFTRYFDRDHFGGPSKRRFWHHQPAGPSRDWTFANLGDTQHDGAKVNARGNASYANGEFVYKPDLGSVACMEGVVHSVNVVPARPTSPKLRPAKAGAGEITFGHFSPYVICGDPADDANPMTAPATGGLVIAGKAVGEVTLEVSANEGQIWHKVATLTAGEFSHDVTDQVKGHYGWQARFTLASEGSGLDQLQFTTVTQVCQAIYPRLKPGGTQVTYRAANRAVVPLLPDFSRPESEAAWEEPKLRSSNLAYEPRSAKQPRAYKTTNNKPATLVFKLQGKTPLVELSAAARVGVRVPPPEKTDFKLEYSLDEGRSWAPLGKTEPPADNEYSSAWLYGRKEVAGGTSALVRLTLYAGGYQTGLLDAQLYALRQTEPASAAVVTYAWKEGGQVKTHREAIPAGAAKGHTFAVPTGAKVTDEWVKIEAP